MPEWNVKPDRELLECALGLSLLVNGRTVIDGVPELPSLMKFAEALAGFGLEARLVGEQLVLEGRGFGYKVPAVLPAGTSPNAKAVLWALASKDTETRFTLFASDCEDFGAEVELLKFVAGVVPEEACGEFFAFHFNEEPPRLKAQSYGGYDYLQRNFALLSSLVRGRGLSFVEKFSLRDGFTSMLSYFGANLRFEVQTPELKSEFERRLAKVQGLKLERTWTTELAETKILSPHDYFAPGDVTEASALALAALLSGANPKESAVIRNVCVGAGRAGVFALLKRMGAQLDYSSKRKRCGEAYADLSVKPLNGRRLQGAKFAGAALVTAFEEIPVLAVAACHAEKETIFHLPPELLGRSRGMIENLAMNLRRTGAEVGVYEDGFVVRGREEPAITDFDCAGFPVVALAFSVMAALAKYGVEVAGSEAVRELFPGALESIAGIAGKEA